MPLPYVSKLMVGLWPGKLLAVTGAAVLEWLFPSTANALLISVGIMLALDAITGVCAAWARNEFITSRGFARTIQKLIGYGACVLVVSLVSRGIAPGVADARAIAVAGVLTVILITEGISVLENAAKMGIKLPPAILRRLKTHLSSAVDGVLPAPEKKEQGEAATD